MEDEIIERVNKIIDTVCGTDDGIEEDGYYTFANDYLITDILTSVSKEFGVDIPLSEVEEIISNEDLFNALEKYL